MALILTFPNLIYFDRHLSALDHDTYSSEELQLVAAITEALIGNKKLSVSQTHGGLHSIEAFLYTNNIKQHD